MVDDLLEARLPRDAKLSFEMQVRRREKRVDSTPFCRLERTRRFVDVLRPAACHCEWELLIGYR